MAALKLLVDESLGLKVSMELKRRGFDVVSVMEVMRGAKDEEVIKRAIDEHRIVLTNDKDFGFLAASYKPPGIVLLRLRNEKMNHKAAMALKIVEKCRDRLEGNIIVVTEKTVRIRPL